MNESLRILLIDDNPDDRTLVIRELSREFPSLKVEQIIEAKGLAQTLEVGDFDLVITDYQLRWSDGLAVLRAVKERYTDCPVIMFTATGNEELAVEAMKSGLEDYILKSPRHFARLPSAARSALENVRQRKVLKEAEEALRISEERYRELVENANDIIYTHDLTGNFTSINKAGEQIIGYTRDEILKMNISQIVASAYLGLARQATDRKVMGEPSSAYELEVIDKSGHRVTLEVSTKLIIEEGKPVGVQGIARDVTERKHLEEQLRQSQKMEAIGELAGGVAHDFNNLLTAIMGYSELALSSLGQDELTRQSIEEVQKAGERAASLTHQLLVFSRRQTLQPRVLSLNAIVVDIEKMLRRLISEDINLITMLGPELKAVKADQGQMQQVIMNLAVNAHDAMPNGGNLTIKTENVNIDEEHCKIISEARKGEFVCLSVADMGVGMDKETIGHIFEPFFTTKEAGEGTGLGLSVIYGIVKQHEGWIEVESEPGQGSTFKVRLPISDVNVEEAKETISLQELQGSGERILLIEDEEIVREVATRTLGKNGYVVFEAKNAKEALYIFEREDGEFHLIFSDVVLPDRSGIQLIDELLFLNSDLKVLLCSGYTDSKSQWPIIDERGFPFLQKPYVISDLLQAIRDAIELN